MRVMGYTRRTSSEGKSVIEAQDQALRIWAASGGHRLVVLASEISPTSREPEDRRILASLLNQLDRGEADALAVVTTMRLALAASVRRLDYFATRQGWRLVILDDLDRDHRPEVRTLRQVQGEVAQFERALISRRTRAALAARRAAGVRLGGPRRCPDDVLARVVELRSSGAQLQDIADKLNSAGTTTPGGGARWWPSHVSRLLATQDARALMIKAPTAPPGVGC